MPTESGFELRGFELYWAGERLPVSPAVVQAVIGRRTREMGTLPSWDHRGRAPVDSETVGRILKLERILAINRLAALFKEAA